MRLLPLALLLAFTVPASAIKVQPPPDPPHVLALSQSDKAGDSTSTLAVYEPSGQGTTILAGIPLGTAKLAAHAGTGRWMMVFHQLSNGDPLELGGKKVSKPDDRNTVVLGDLAGVTGWTYGDKACTNKKKACFETPLTFSADGSYVYVRSEASSWATVNRWSFGKKPKMAAITAKKPGALAIARDLLSAAYVARDGVHVVKFPAPKKKPKKIKPTKKAVAAPDLLASDVAVYGSALFWFRKDPVDQQHGFYELFDPASKQTTTVLEVKSSPAWNTGPFLPTARGTLLFTHEASYEHLDLYEAFQGGGTATKITGNVLELLDVSPEGRYALVTKRKDPKQLDGLTNPVRLVIVDLVMQQDVYTIDTGGDGRKITAGAFVSAP